MKVQSFHPKFHFQIFLSFFSLIMRIVIILWVFDLLKSIEYLGLR
jgi:hypothetical protein